MEVRVFKVKEKTTEEGFGREFEVTFLMELEGEALLVTGYYAYPNWYADGHPVQEPQKKVWSRIEHILPQFANCLDFVNPDWLPIHPDEQVTDED